MWQQTAALPTADPRPQNLSRRQSVAAEIRVRGEWRRLIKFLVL
jgi:hypothetical protein